MKNDANSNRKYLSQRQRIMNEILATKHIHIEDDEYSPTGDKEVEICFDGEEAEELAERILSRMGINKPASI